MRKLILIAAVLLASASAQAGENRDRILAAADAPVTADASATSNVGAPLPPIQKADDKPQTTEKPQTSERQQAQQAEKLQLAKSAKAARLRRYESDEAKARRIAARYGISW